MRISDIALSMDKRDVDLLKKISGRGAIYVHKSNDVLSLLQNRLVQFVYDATKKQYRVTLAPRGAQVAAELAKVG